MNGYLHRPEVGVIVVQRYPGYKDVPGLLYHFPRQRYEPRMRALQGGMALLYEPRRGGDRHGGKVGGRIAFTGVTTVGDIYVDPDDSTHCFAKLVNTVEFPSPVPLSKTRISGQRLQSAVTTIPSKEAEDILSMGFSLILPAERAATVEGMVELSVTAEDWLRPISERLTRRPVRDAAFRYRVVDQAYRGQCALSGVRMTNGFGRAEADAAHIRPVADGGPDAVQNGMALTKTLHWAFDRGLVSLEDDGRILTVERGLHKSILAILPSNGIALLPEHPAERPHHTFLRWHRENKFKGAA